MRQFIDFRATYLTFDGSIKSQVVLAHNEDATYHMRKITPAGPWTHAEHNTIMSRKFQARLGA